MKGFRFPRLILFVLITLAGLLAVPLYLVMSNAVQSSSLTCKRCHAEPFATWRASSEHPAISCAQCHVGHPSPSSLPPAFVADYDAVDPLCLSCHQDVAEKTDVKRKLIKISHRRHFDEGLGCLDCHRYTAHSPPSFQSSRPPKKACYRCHILEIDGSVEDRSCQMCHYIILTTLPPPY